MPFFRKYTLENAPMPPISRIDLDIIPDKCTSIFSSSWCNEICFQDWPLSLSHDQYLSVKWQKKKKHYCIFEQYSILWHVDKCICFCCCCWRFLEKAFYDLINVAIIQKIITNINFNFLWLLYTKQKIKVMKNN